MPQLANEIIVTQLRVGSVDDGFKLIINGEEFPWHIHNDLSTNVSSDDIPSITITIPADRVVVENLWSSRGR